VRRYKVWGESEKGKDDIKSLKEWIELGEFQVKKCKSGILYGRFKYHWNERRTNIRRVALQDHAHLRKVCTDIKQNKQK